MAAAWPSVESLEKNRWFETTHVHTAMNWLLRVLPVVSKAQIPLFFGRSLNHREEAAIRSMVADRHRVRDRWYHDLVTIFRRRGWKDGGAIGFYQNKLWNPFMAPGVLASAGKPGDWLLLGSDLVSWARTFADESDIPLHWAVEAGGYGAGMLVRHLGGVRQEWVIYLERHGGRDTIHEVMAGVIQELGPLINAAVNAGLVLEVRLIWGSAMLRRGFSGTRFRERAEDVNAALKDLGMLPSLRGGRSLPTSQVGWHHGIVLGRSSARVFEVIDWHPLKVKRWVKMGPNPGVLMPLRENNGLVGKDYL